MPLFLSLLLGLGLTGTSGAQAAPKTPATKRTPATTPTKHATKRKSTAKRPTRHRAASKRARPRRHRSTAVFPSDLESTPAYRYSQLESEACYRELEKRDLPTQRETKAWPGLTAPVRVTSPIHGVRFRTDRGDSELATSPYELFDCRLVLALDDFTELLRAEGIVEVVYSSAYRPTPKSVAMGDQGKRHAGGLAIDVHRFRQDDGTWIKVEQDFHGRIGATVCGKSAASPVRSSPAAKLLRRLVCGAADQRLFQCILTPDYDYPHRNHLHLEVRAGVRWFIVS